VNTNENTNKLLGILQSHAPTGAAQQECSELYWDLQKNNETIEAVELGLVHALLDGLRYGNWPWTKVRNE
jgi:hypothetical protein